MDTKTKTITANVSIATWRTLRKLAKSRGRVFRSWLAEQLTAIAAKGEKP